MVSHLSGVAKLIKAILTKCYAHSLSLSVKNATKQWEILSDVMCATKKIIALIKFSPKREKILGDIKTNIEEQPHVGGLLKFSPTRWTVRAIGFNRILCNGMGRIS